MHALNRKASRRGIPFFIFSVLILIVFASAPLYNADAQSMEEDSPQISANPYEKHFVHFRKASPIKFQYAPIREALLILVLPLLFLRATPIPRFTYRTFIPIKMKSLFLMPIKFTSTFFLPNTSR